MDAKKILNEQAQGAFRKSTKRHLSLASTKGTYTEQLRASYERLVGVIVWSYTRPDSVIYVQDCGRFGFKAIKFYNDGVDYRIGSFQESEALALNEAINSL